MTVFKEATEVFMTRIPKKRCHHGQQKRFTTSSQAHRQRQVTVGISRNRDATYARQRITAYCSDRTKHPTKQDGKHKKVSPNVQKAIMKRRK